VGAKRWDRQKLLYDAGAGAFKDREQAASDSLNAQNDLKTAQGHVTAARNRLRASVGKSDAEIAKFEGTHYVDRVLTGAPTQSPGVPPGAIVREGDGTMTAWVTSDGKRVGKRRVKVGLQQDGFAQIVGGR